MSKYTIQLRELCNLYGRSEIENWFKDYEITDYLTADQVTVIENSNTWSKDKLAKKIVDNYFMCEIGFETPGLFKLETKVVLNQVMEEYLPLIYSRCIEYDPLVNVDYTESFNRNIQGTGTNSSNSTASGLTVNSDTPQGQIDKDEILQGKYASTTGASETAGSVSDTSNSNSDETYTKHVKGNSGVSATAQKMIEQFRNNIVAIDRDIIKKLSILFMGLF